MIYYTKLLFRFTESFASLASFYGLKAVRQKNSALGCCKVWIRKDKDTTSVILSIKLKTKVFCCPSEDPNNKPSLINTACVYTLIQS